MMLPVLCTINVPPIEPSIVIAGVVVVLPIVTPLLIVSLFGTAVDQLEPNALDS